MPDSGWMVMSKWQSKSVECVSVGYIIEECEDRLTLAPHIAHHDDGDHRQAAGVMVIPKRSIISREVLVTCPKTNE